MEFDQILENLRKKIVHPVYFLCGEEPYFTDIISDYIENKLLTAEEKGFNQSIFYGRDTELKTVLEACRRYPMLANHQVVIAKEAQSWKNLEPLVKYLKAPSVTTVLVINYKYSKPDMRTQEGKEIRDKTVYLETKSLRDYQLPAWIEDYVKTRGYSITPQASQMLIDFLGSDLSKITNELNKLFIVVPAGRKITPDEIEKNIGISKEFNAFELSDALGEKNVLKANHIIHHFAANPNDNPIQPVIGALFGYFSKVLKYHYLPDKSTNAVGAALGIGSYPYIIRKYADAAKKFDRKKLMEIIGILREYDLKSKGLESSSGVSEGDMLKEMVYKILH
jgi:DNA polymerase III subunit delta